MTTINRVRNEFVMNVLVVTTIVYIYSTVPQKHLTPPNVIIGGLCVFRRDLDVVS